MKGILKPTKLKRFLFFFLFDIFLTVFFFYFSFYLRFGFTFPEKYYHLIFYWTAGFLTLHLFLLFIAGLYKPFKDIDVVFTGLRPGEKLFEEPLSAEEGIDMNCHEKIFVARNGYQLKSRRLKLVLKELGKALSRPEEIVSVLKKYIPYFKIQQLSMTTMKNILVVTV